MDLVWGGRKCIELLIYIDYVVNTCYIYVYMNAPNAAC